jgi:hypothetical protein
MSIIWLKNIGRFIFLVFFQILILNNIRFSGYINPYFYVYFILLLPFDTPRWLLLSSAFLLGFALDLFSNTPGLNSAACVLTAFSRPIVITSISSGTEYLIGNHPSLKSQGIKWFSYYSVILVLIHHLSLFYLEIFRLTEFFQTLVRVLLSAVFTLLLIFISEYLFYSRQ